MKAEDRVTISIAELAKRAERSQQLLSKYHNTQRDLELAKELLGEYIELLERFLQVCNLSVDALLSSKEGHLRVLGKAFGEEMHGAMQYGFHLESDKKFQQFYRQDHNK